MIAVASYPNLCSNRRNLANSSSSSTLHPPPGIKFLDRQKVDLLSFRTWVSPLFAQMKFRKGTGMKNRKVCNGDDDCAMEVGRVNSVIFDTISCVSMCCNARFWCNWSVWRFGQFRDFLQTNQLGARMCGCGTVDVDVELDVDITAMSLWQCRCTGEAPEF